MYLFMCSKPFTHNFNLLKSRQFGPVLFLEWRRGVVVAQKTAVKEWNAGRNGPGAGVASARQSTN